MFKKTLFLISLWIFTSASVKKSQFILWNVGQGQWASYINLTNCHHIDMGGDFFYYWDKVLKLCSQKKNSISISHWDKDHYSFLFSFLKYFRKVCFHNLPQHIPPKIQLHLKNYPNCKHPEITTYQLKSSAKTKNNASYITDHKYFLYPADIDSTVEKLIPKLTKKKVFILSHHGSKYSNSLYFIDLFAPPVMALVSARKAKYGHPHQLITERLKLRQIPLLQTEIWGNIHILLP